MVQQQSKKEQVSKRISEGIKSLRREGAGLEWVDKEGRTPLILACNKAKLYDVVKTLVESGSNVNAYCPGRNGGTPLHYAAKRGLENTVKLLLSHGANPLVRNDDLQTPLEVARGNGYSNVVRAIESQICFFSGWMRQFYGPSFAPQLLSRKVWVAIVPTCSRNPFNLELVVYASPQDAQPRTVMALCKAKLEEPKSYDSDASVMIVDNSTGPKRRSKRIIRSFVSDARRWAQVDKQVRLKLAAATIGDMEQLNWFCDACKGIPQPMNPPIFLQTTTSALESSMNEMALLNHHASMANLDFISHEHTPLAAVDGSIEEDGGGCVICLNASPEAACVPCGHVAGCISCLKEIKDKNMGCPVCRSNIDQVIKLYHV